MRDPLANREGAAINIASADTGATQRSPRTIRRTLIIAFLVFIGCYLGAAAGTLLQFPVVGNAVIFPPYAVLAAALMLTRARTWWIFVTAAALGNYWPHFDKEESVSFVLLAETANAIRALVAAGGLRILGGRIERLKTLGHMAAFLTFAAILGPLAGAFIGAADVKLHNPSADFWLTWQSWLLSNTIVGLTFLPMIVLVSRSGVAWIKHAGPRRLLEAGALLLGLMAVGIYVLTDSQVRSNLPAYLYGPLPFLLWAAIRFGPCGTALALSAIAALTIHGAFSGLGPFVTQSPAENLLQLQLFLIAMSVPLMVLAAIAEQNARASSELQQSQNRYRSVVEDQTELICRFLSDGTFTFVNRAYARYFGRTPEELLGRSFWMFIPAENHPGIKMFLNSITIDSPVATIEHEVVGPEGEVRWQQWTDRALFDDDGRIVEYQAVGRDVTDSKRAEEEHRLLEAQRRVEEALRETDRRKDEFLAMLAHELRNPLAPISMAVEIMRRQPASNRESALAQDIISRQIGQMTRLVDDLLDVSRITLGKIRLKMETVDLRSVIDQAVETSRSLLEKRQHQLRISMTHMPAQVLGDTARLAQIVDNLLNNAAKYTEPGGRIELTVVHDEPNLVLTVKDNGVGIPPEMLKRIFDLFTQGQNMLETTQGGLGIGLTLVKRLVELHGGEVEARSGGPGQGSEFTVRLPALSSPALHGQVQAPLSDREGMPMRILVVDDNIDAADCLAQLLGFWGHTTQIVHDGVSAIEAEAGFSPDAVLLDLGLPLLDGLEVARRLRQKRQSRPLLLIAMTGFGQHEDRLRSAAAGFDHHLTKPIDVETLHSLLGAWTAVSPTSIRKSVHQSTIATAPDSPG
jgi:PAS domain S-box-containing protein